MKNIKFKYTCFVYGLLSLLSIGLNRGTKNNFLKIFCFWYGKCHNNIILLKLFLLKNQIDSENFNYCKERWESDWAENWQPIKSLDSHMEDWTLKYCYLPFLECYLPLEEVSPCLTSNITRINSVIHCTQNTVYIRVNKSQTELYWGC